MSIQTGFSFNRNEKCLIVSPDFLTLPKVEIATDKFIDSGDIVDVEGNLCTIEKTHKWYGIVTEANFYNTAGGKALKPSGNVVAYYSGLRIVTKNFKDDAAAPIKKGDALTVVEGKLQKTDSAHTVPVMQVLDRGTDYIECVTI